MSSNFNILGGLTGFEFDSLANYYLGQQQQINSGQLSQYFNNIGIKPNFTTLNEVIKKEKENNFKNSDKESEVVDAEWWFVDHPKPLLK